MIEDSSVAVFDVIEAPDQVGENRRVHFDSSWTKISEFSPNIGAKDPLSS
jgi:hypothetical protein